MRFTFWGQPVPKPRMTQQDKWLKPPRPEVGRWFTFKDAFLLQARTAGFKAGDLICEIHVKFFMKIRGGLHQRGSWHTLKPDLSNMLKAVEDALVDEDEMIYKESLEKRWDDGQGERIEITLFVKQGQ